MPQKSWKIPLSDGSVLHISLVTRGGRIESFAVILVADVDGELMCVSRYDTAHGQAHRDILGRRRGLMRKDWLFNLTPEEAFDSAISDLRTHHAHYIEFFLQH